MKHLSLALAVVTLLLGWSLVHTEVSRGTTEHQFMNLPGRVDNNPYSTAVRVGDTLYLSGDIGTDPETGRPPAAVEEEVRLVMDDMKQALDLADMTTDDLVMVQVFCSDVSLYDAFNNAYRTYFSDHFPARAFLGSGPLLRGARFEVNGIAVKQ